MRTTITIDDDVLGQARILADKLNTSFRKVVNEALRAGLKIVEKPIKSRVYKTIPHDMKIHKGYDLDNIQEILAQVEGDSFK